MTYRKTCKGLCRTTAPWIGKKCTLQFQKVDRNGKRGGGMQLCGVERLRERPLESWLLEPSGVMGGGTMPMLRRALIVACLSVASSTTCGVGKYSAGIDSSCHSCPSNTYQPVSSSNVSECHECPQGSSFINGPPNDLFSACELCDPGYAAARCAVIPR